LHPLADHRRGRPSARTTCGRPTPSAGCRRRKVLPGDVAAQLGLANDRSEELIRDLNDSDPADRIISRDQLLGAQRRQHRQLRIRLLRIPTFFLSIRRPNTSTLTEFSAPRYLAEGGAEGPATSVRLRADGTSMSARPCRAGSHTIPRLPKDATGDTGPARLDAIEWYSGNVEWGWLLLAFLVLVVLAVAFVFLQARRRAGGVIATRSRRQRRRT